MPTTLGALIGANAASLLQASDLIARLDDRCYSASPAGFEPHKAGGHLRHILEFYECLLDALASHAPVDYNARKRDPAVETSRTAALERIASTIARLQELPDADRPLLVHSDDLNAGGALLPSSLSRELLSLSSHTTHHFALISMTLRAHGFAVDPSFGMAPSTLRHHAEKAA